MNRTIQEMTLLSGAPRTRLPITHRIISQEEIDAGKYLIYLAMAICGLICWLVTMGIIYWLFK